MLLLLEFYAKAIISLSVCCTGRGMTSSLRPSRTPYYPLISVQKYRKIQVMELMVTKTTGIGSPISIFTEIYLWNQVPGAKLHRNTSGTKSKRFICEKKLLGPGPRGIFTGICPWDRKFVDKYYQNDNK